MTAKLSDESISLIMRMFKSGTPTADIAKAVGCAPSTVVKYLNAAGIVLGNKGKPKQLTAEYLTLALDMRARGAKWCDVEKKIGFHPCTFRRELRAMRAQQ
ncbi:helix-turn-helix domain-containing protein [Pseudomonas fluorescens]|uniref:helix-turn-helix domain-containing protein n=1 Tax=Pseudomonas fluorescens TaxID=294 RepID=UPI003D23478C